MIGRKDLPPNRRFSLGYGDNLFRDLEGGVRFVWFGKRPLVLDKYWVFKKGWDDGWRLLLGCKIGDRGGLTEWLIAWKQNPLANHKASQHSTCRMPFVQGSLMLALGGLSTCLE